MSLYYTVDEDMFQASQLASFRIMTHKKRETTEIKNKVCS